MTVRFDDLDTGWRFSAVRPPDVRIELLWAHARGRWLQGTVVGDGTPTQDPIPIALRTPQGVDEDERREDAAPYR